MSLNFENQLLWTVYITISNLDAKLYRSQNQPNTLLLGFILIVYEWLEDLNNKNRDLKAKIYYLALKTMLECK